MELHQLHKQIVDSKLGGIFGLNGVFVFTGDEIAVMDIYIEQIQKALNCTSSRVDSVQEAHQRMSKKTMTKQSRLFIVRDDKEFLKQDKVWENVEKDFENGTDTLIIIYTALDKRGKFYKKYKDQIVVFDKLNPDILVKYVQKEIPLVDTMAKKLVELCECNYSRILLECDKIKHYYEAKKDELSTGYEGAFIRLWHDGVIYQPIGDITFKFTDAIALRDYAATAKYLQQAKAKQEPEIMVLAILYNTFKQILLVQGLGRDKTNAAARTGLTSWQVNMAMQKLGHYSVSELIRALKTIRMVEKGIKTGQIEAGMSLDYLIVNIM